MPVNTTYTASRADGDHADCFLFIYGEGEEDYYAYTNSERSILLDGKTYLPRPIEAEDFTRKGKSVGAPIRINCSAELEISQFFQGVIPRRRIFFRLYSGDISPSPAAAPDGHAGTFDLVWAGNVIERSRKAKTVTFTCDTLGAGMKRPGLTRFYQRECPHVLYGEYCQANKAAATVAATVSGNPTTRTVTLAPGWAGSFPAAKFLGGLIEWDGDLGREVRQIVDRNGNTLTVDASISSDLVDGGDVDVVLGCGRNMADCEDLHDNILNYGGMPYIPFYNPINKNNHT